MKSLFKESMSNLDAFLTKKALGQIKDDFSFFEEEGEYSKTDIGTVKISL